MVGRYEPPAVIASDIGVVVPIALGGQPGHHGINHGRSSKGSSTGVVHTQQLRTGRRTGLTHPVLALLGEPRLMAVLVVPLVALGVVLDEELPGDGGGVGSESTAWGLVAGFDEEDRVSRLGEVYGQNATTRSATNYDIVVYLGFLSGCGAGEDGKTEEALGEEPAGAADFAWELHREEFDACCVCSLSRKKKSQV